MNIFNTLKQAVKIATLVTTVHSQAIAENFSLDNTQDHITTVSENNTDSIITAMVRKIIDDQSQLECDLEETEAKITMLRQSAQSINDNEEYLKRTFSEQGRAKIETTQNAMIDEISELLDKRQNIKETLMGLEKDKQGLLKKLEDAATFRYLNPSPESKD